MNFTRLDDTGEEYRFLNAVTLKVINIKNWKCERHIANGAAC